MKYLSGIEHVNPIIIWMIFISSLIYIFYILRGRKKTYVTYFFILISFGGIFEYIGQNIQHLYELFVFFYILFYIIYNKKKIVKRSIIVWFSVFSVFYLLMSVVHGMSDPLSDLRQYIIYSLPILIFIFLFNNMNIVLYNDEYGNLQNILKVQIFASILKLIFIGVNEKMVGVLTISNAHLAAVFPVFFFVLYWLKDNGKLSKNDWFWIISSLLVAVASAKRAVWFYFPITIFLYHLFYNKIKFKFNSVIIILFIPFVFYFGARVNPSLNPEHAEFGSFNIDHIKKYVFEYSIGGEEINIYYATGRLGGNVYYLNKILNDFFAKENFFGFGNSLYNKYEGKSSQNINVFGFKSKFMLTGWSTMFIRFGLIVLILFLITINAIFKSINNRRDYYLLLFVFYSWFIFYTGAIITNSLMSSIFILIIIVGYYKSNLKFIAKSTD